jgi:predicted site-specific integrase-resolvase
MGGPREGEVRARWAAHRLGVNIRTIRRWGHEGRIWYRQDAAGKYWFKKSEIDHIEKHPEKWRQGLI